MADKKKEETGTGPDTPDEVEIVESPSEHPAEDGDGVRNAEALAEVSKVEPDPRLHLGAFGAKELGVDVNLPEDKDEHPDENVGKDKK